MIFYQDSISQSEVLSSSGDFAQLINDIVLKADSPFHLRDAPGLLYSPEGISFGRTFQI